MKELKEIERDLRDAGYSYTVSKEIDGTLQAKIVIIVGKLKLNCGSAHFDELPGYH